MHAENRTMLLAERVSETGPVIILLLQTTETEMLRFAWEPISCDC